MPRKGSSERCTAGPSDWLQDRRVSWLWPAVFALAGCGWLLAPGAWGSSATATGFAVAGALCVGNAIHCRRVHCALTGPLYLAAGLYADALAAHRRLAAAAQDGEQVTQDVLAAVARQYYGLQEAQARIKIAEEALAAARELARIGRDRETQGAGLKVDVLRAEARVAADEVLLARARKGLRDASVRLALTLRLDPAITLFPMETVVRQQTVVDPEVPLGVLTERAAAHRPDLAAELRRVAAAENHRRADWAGAVGPSIYGAFEESAIGDRIDDLGNRQIYGGFVGLRLSPASIGQVQAAEARLEQARLSVERLRQQIAAEVIATREEALTAQEQIEAGVRGLRAAEAALDLSQVRFKGGVGIGLEVLDAQAALSESRTSLVTAIVAYNAAEVSLLRALGGISVAALRGPGSGAM